jgi:NAD(P)-dependent dehydrogenase (short-subunit alcohol dehydrogenase family)
LPPPVPSPAAVARVAAEIEGTPVVLDLAHPEPVREVAARLPALDVVVANAGVQFTGPPTFTTGGVEETLASRARPQWQQLLLRTVARPLTALASFAVTSGQSGATLASLVLNPTGPSGSVVAHHRGFGDRSARASDPAYQDALLAAARQLLAPTPA